MIPDNVENIIFDLGGVIIDIDPKLTFQAFNELVNEEYLDTTLNALDSFPFFAEFERGLISSDDFLQKLLLKCKTGTSEMDVLNAWNAILLDIDMEKRDLLFDLKEKFNTYLLSNTNEIHRLWIDDYIQAYFDDAGLNSWFKKVYTSYEMHLQKPEPQIFQAILSENELDPTRTLFIDDTEKHLKGAEELGIQTILATEKNTILEIFCKC